MMRKLPNSLYLGHASYVCSTVSIAFRLCVVILFSIQSIKIIVCILITHLYTASIYMYIQKKINMQLYSFLQIVKFIAHLPNTLGRLFLNVPRYISTCIWFLKLCLRGLMLSIVYLHFLLKISYLAMRIIK